MRFGLDRFLNPDKLRIYSMEVLWAIGDNGPKWLTRSRRYQWIYDSLEEKVGIMGCHLFGHETVSSYEGGPKFHSCAWCGSVIKSKVQSASTEI